MKFRFVLLVVVAFAINVPVSAAEVQVVAGAGPSTRVVELFFREFAKLPAAAGYEFSVPHKSVKHHGGIGNSYRYLFGRTGRPLTGDEKALGKGEIFLAKVPIVFVGGHGVDIRSLSLRELERIYRKKYSNWQKLGGRDAPITTVGREQSEALFSELKDHYTFFRQVDFDKIFYRDHEVVEFIRSPEGRYAIAFGAAPNFYGMNILYIEEDLQAGVRLGLVYDLKNAAHPLVEAVKAYAGSDQWRDVLAGSDLGLSPVR